MTPPPRRIAGEAVDFARAKINLALHVVGRRADGYHLLDSLVVFPEVGDLLTAQPAAGLSLTLEGPFGPALAPASAAPEIEVSSPVCYLSAFAPPENLVLRAAEALRAALPGAAAGGAALTLEKNLPVASGIGGGSADAAAALRLLVRLWGLEIPAEELARIALGLGADVPVCLAARPARMRGIGEDLTPFAPPAGALVLVNPGAGLSTPEVFRLLETRENPPLPEPPSGLDAAGLALWLREKTRNDLEAPALARLPVVGEVLAALRATGAPLARMSGSGATCFGLFPDLAGAERAARTLRAKAPRGWWIASGACAAPEL
ncbi:4-(cytidine 5'-diphospho)-2-C-methyl-D-erythritol kinase [Neomegalonema sp.]|uniref:4-(cytidine 5'-diphospho)-2-C-methyl-D-erythritol kinase n=1 Tax=Neomegalonema sp. TaxID=2039713 RepID=UPI002624D606|nr:4-(cytidine 5'-diphospho)-2-C-methyl-D-erythritol kinase [Neomegalonema sp.]MDD2868221.1 4-(cytidine 5'-diphospho)-2-C-methyl-D-erythritol kinase [Neomegalonema sp.]